MSKTAGLIHIIPAHDYLGIVRTLLTPAEIIDYLGFRREIIERWPDHLGSVPEQALVGQYLHEDEPVMPDVAHAEYLPALEQNTEQWDLSGIIARFPRRITTDGNPSNYYPIITEFALLRRNELGELKTLFKRAVEKARGSEFALPYRIAVPRTNCGFVFIPLPDADLFSRRSTALLNLTMAHKYDKHLTKCVGVAIGNCSDDGDFQAEWCYISGPWEHDEEMESTLSSSYPFRPEAIQLSERYNFKPRKQEPAKGEDPH